MAVQGSGEQRLFGLQDDQFELGCQLGRGGQAVVYECTRTRTGHKYAVKVIDTVAKAFTRMGEQHLQRELRNMEELFHPRIVNLHRAFWEPEQCLIVMDLASGGDLHGKVESEVLSFGQPYKGLGGSEHASKHVALQLIDGITYLHEHGIIHRDLKLENVLIVRSYPCLAEHLSDKPRELLDVKIADLGYSKMVGSRPREDDGRPAEMRRTHSAVGSPDFVAPEVLTQDYDHRADFWSFGVMLYALLCGCWPFRISGKQDLQRDRHRELVSSIHECASWKNASDKARSMIQGLLTVDPDKRLGMDGCLRHPWLLEGEEKMGPRASRRRSRGHSNSGVTLAGLLEGPCAVVKEIHAKRGDAVDSVELELHDGTVRSYGGTGGEREGHWFLKDEEFIIGIMQEARPTYLGNAIVFFTSHGRSIPVEGINAHRRNRFVAPRGSQIVGLQFENSQLIGIHLEKIVDGKGAVETIFGWAGHAVDRIVIKLREGSERSYGDAGGQEIGPWALESDECILIVEQARRDAFLGNAVTLFTSKGKIIRIEGVHAVQCRRFMVLPGHQLCGLQFDGSAMVKVATCPENGNLEEQQWTEVLVA